MTEIRLVIKVGLDMLSEPCCRRDQRTCSAHRNKSYKFYVSLLLLDGLRLHSKWVGSQLQPFFKALVNQDFDIDASVEFTAYDVRIVGKPMGTAIADGHKNASHWDVLNLIEITGYGGGTECPIHCQ